MHTDRTLNYAATVLFVAMFLLGSFAAAAGEPKVIDAAPRIDTSRPDCGIQAVIDEAASTGGGTVVLPAGRFPLELSLVLKSGVTLKGQGNDTVLAAALDEHRAEVAPGLAKDATMIELDGDLSSLAPGRTLSLWPRGRMSHHSHRKQAVVKSVDGKRVSLEQPFGMQTGTGAFVAWGLRTSLAAAAKAGETSVRVADPAVFEANVGIALTGPGDVWNHHWNQVERIEGDTLHLAWPLTVSPAAGSIAQRMHSLITAEGVKNVGVEDLALEGFADERKPAGGGFYLAALHTNEAKKIAVRRVTVRNWHSDAFSFQSGGDLVVEDCTATNNFGHGFHPGTGYTEAEFRRVNSAGNAADGFYYCWNNRHVNLRESKLTGNGGYGVGGLGIPGDSGNLVEGNLIEGNGLAGVEMMGGPKSHGNTVVGNTIRDNSRAKPGKYPGVLITACWKEGGTGAVIRDNTIESTLSNPTQWVGIEERHAPPMKGHEDKADPATGLVMVDESTIEGNHLSGHKTADIVIRGLTSKATGNEGRIVEERPPR